jgi:hypothetical protein
MEIEVEFINYCKNGDLVLARDLLQQNPKINISADNEGAFRWACYNSQFHVAQWLLSVKPNINISFWNNYLFFALCHLGNLNAALWLLTVKPSIDISKANKNAGFFFVKSFLLYCFNHKNINLFLF